MKKPGTSSRGSSNGAEAAPDIDKIFSEGSLIEKALRKSAARAARLHEREGLPMVVFQGGRTRLVSPRTFLRPKGRSKKR